MSPSIAEQKRSRRDPAIRRFWRGGEGVRREQPDLATDPARAILHRLRPMALLDLEGDNLGSRKQILQ